MELRDVGDNMLVAAVSLTAAKKLMENAMSGGMMENIAKGLGPLGMLGGAVSSLVESIFEAIPFIFLMGFVFAFVLPALPWFFWVIGIVGFMIFFAEAMIAINIWMVAQGHPDGEGPTSSVGKEGTMLLIRLIFQPSVMVLAFAAAIMLMEISGRFVATYTMPVLSSHLDSIFSFIGIAVMFMVIMVAVTWTIFGLISQLSSQVFQWIGQAHHDLGENKGESAFMGAMVSSKGAVHVWVQGQPHKLPKSQNPFWRW